MAGGGVRPAALERCYVGGGVHLFAFVDLLT